MVASAVRSADARPAPGDLRRQRAAQQAPSQAPRPSAVDSAFEERARSAGQRVRGLTVDLRGPRPQGKPVAPVAAIPWRLVGGAIDLLVLLILTGVVNSFVLRATPGTTQIRIDADTGAQSILVTGGQGTSLIAWVSFLIAAVYIVVPTALWGRTIGAFCVGIACVRADTCGRPGWGVAVRRWMVVYGAAGLLAFIPYVGSFAWFVVVVVAVSPYLDRSGYRQGWQDRFAGDLVVRRPLH